MISCCCGRKPASRIRNWPNGGPTFKCCRKKSEWRWFKRGPRSRQRKDRLPRAVGAAAVDAAERRAVNNEYALAPSVRGDRQQLRISPRTRAPAHGAEGGLGRGAGPVAV